MVRRTWHVIMNDFHEDKTFEADNCIVAGNGTLQFQRFEGDVMTWVGSFAAGMWVSFECDPLTEEQIKSVLEEVAREKAIAELQKGMQEKQPGPRGPVRFN